MVAYAPIYVDADATTMQSPAYGAGAGPHLAVGSWSGTKYRSVLRFAKPAWGSWKSISSAKLHIFTSDHAHVGVRNSSILVRRMATGAVWTKGAGVQSCNSGYSASNNTQYTDIVPTATDGTSFMSGTAANAEKIVAVGDIVRAYFAADSANITLVLDGETASDYSEFWADEAAGYAAYLDIEYTAAVAPDPPVLVAPLANATGQTTTPTFSWTHDATDGPQTGADVDLFEDSGPTHIGTFHVTGSAGSLVCPVPLDPGFKYSWKVRTSNSTGTGLYSTSRLFTVGVVASVALEATRRTVWDTTAKAPRLLVAWTTAGITQAQYKVTSASPASDTGWITAGNRTHVVQAALTDNVPLVVTVQVRDVVGGGTLVSDSHSFTPRYGLTTHRRDLTAAPDEWQSASILPSTQPVDATLKMEYGSNALDVAAPTAWHDDIGSVPLARYLYWRAWFLPNASQGPTLDKVTITSLTGASPKLDKWGMNLASLPDAVPVVAQTAMTAPWSADSSEYVYGSRSARCSVSGAGPFYLYSMPMRLRAGRSYILTGLMKSQGDSGAQLQLVGADALPVKAPDGRDIVTDELTGDTLFYNQQYDVNRYASPIYVVGEADIIVWVALRAGGVAGSKAWFDAVKVEESSVATAWSPGALGASIVDAGGVQVDGSKGGVFRYRGVLGGARDVVEGGDQGLVFGGDTEVTSPSVGALSVNGRPIGGDPPIRRVYTASGTWTKPAGLVAVDVEVVGGGGGGGGVPVTTATQMAAGGGGGAGGYVKKLWKASDLTGPYNFTVGPGGAGGPSAGGSPGTASTFVGPSTLTGAAGGNGGSSGAASVSAYPTGGSGGAATGGDINVPGGPGSNAGIVTGIRVHVGGGGHNPLGTGGRAGSAAAGSAGAGYGGGGGGASAGNSNGANIAGGDGAGGAVIVTEYYGPAGGVSALVGASYKTQVAQSFTSGAALAVVNFTTMVFDPAGLVTVGAAWKFTAPATGYYSVAAMIAFAGSSGWAPPERGLLELFKNGVDYRALDRKDNQPNVSSLMYLSGSTVIQLNAGDYIDVRLTQNSGGALALSVDDTANWIDIVRVA